MKKKILCLLSAVLLTAVVFSGCFEETKNTPTVKSKTIYVDEHGGKDYTSIQSAINAANTDDTIYVYNGIYNENISISKTINLIGENKNTTIINGGGHEDVLYISADHINISDFTIQNGTVKLYSYNQGGVGIDVCSNYNSITNNIITSNPYYGIYIHNFNNNVIYSNNINNNGDGIMFGESNNNAISGNTIENNYQYGIYLSTSCQNNTISGNTITNNSIFLDNSCNNNLISDNTISNSEFNGIEFNYYSNNNIISGNAIINNSGDGIYFVDSSNNVISGNTINNNSGIGIHFLHAFFPCSGNIIYHNNLINNTLNAIDTNNTWYNTTLKEGNYWSDYHGADTNDDGIGDTPYNIRGGNNKDMYPLMNPVNI